VLDDEDNSITAGSIVTVTVSLRRKHMMDDFDITAFTGERDEPVVGDDGDVVEEGENEETVAKVGGGRGV